MRIRTLPVYSRLAEETAVPPEVQARLPEGWRLSQHQVETYTALTKGNADVIFNTAMTGDGKSLAGQLPALIRGCDWPMMAMYPTNELIRDQRQQLALTMKAWNASLYCDEEPLTSERLNNLLEAGDYTQRSEALLGVLQTNDVLLTNPDIFHYIMEQFYIAGHDAPDRIAGRLAQRFSQLTFDEFHIFDIPQVISVLNALLFIDEIRSTAHPHRYLFLSATPGELMLEYLHRSGLEVCEIQGAYCHSEARPDPAQWRQILHAATVDFPPEPRVEVWIEEHLDDTLLPFFLERRPSAKGAIIVNSVAAAKRLVAQLKPLLAAHQLTVEENTGATSPARRKDSYAADVLIGTSTVDVGVDFQINFLLFESRDGGTFLQRLGRLGRHNGYTRDEQFYPFRDFVAYAVTPSWVRETLFEGKDGVPRLLEPEAMMNREQFNAAIREAYPLPARFDAYARLWGELQTVKIMSGLSNATVREQYKEIRPRLQQRYEATFGIRLHAAWGRYKDLRARQKVLLEEAEAFRGGSYFSCCLIDETEQGANRFKCVNLFLVAAHAELQSLDEETFYAEVARAGLTRRLFERQEPLAFYRLYGWREDREEVKLRLNRDIRGWGAEQFGRAQALKGFQIDTQLPGLPTLNHRLERRELPALLCLGFHPLELKRRLRLPLLFAVFSFTSCDGVAGCVAFGREALLLEARLQVTKIDCGGGAMVF
ncbi:MAG TPA: type I-D CRISPR-associated helicase Cas3' [Anaerolineae bacterium]|nr:type I-D CRISPR-associated helicase Cas3' [Anaerolineae bacterium]